MSLRHKLRQRPHKQCVIKNAFIQGTLFSVSIDSSVHLLTLFSFNSNGKSRVFCIRENSSNENIYFYTETNKNHQILIHLGS